MEIDLELIRRVGNEKGGAAALARASGVPYTTIRSMGERDWGHRSIETLTKLTQAARQIDAEAA